MDDKTIIKEKLKEGKQKLKKEKHSYFSFIVIAMIQGVSILIIPSNSKWKTVVLLGYLFLTAFIYTKIFGAYKLMKYKNKEYNMIPESIIRTYKKGFKYFNYISMIVTVIMIFIRKWSIWTIIAPIINMCYLMLALDDFPFRYSLEKTFSYVDELKDLEKKAIKMHLKFFFILSLVLALIGSFLLYGGYNVCYIRREKNGYILLIIISLVMIFIWNIITKIVINVFSKSKERTINKAFDLSMGEWKNDKGKWKNNKIEYDDDIYSPRILYNYGIMYYKILVIPCAIAILLCTSKFDISTTIMLAAIYTYMSSLIEYSVAERRGLGGSGGHTAFIKNSDGKITGTIDYY